VYENGLAHRFRQAGYGVEQQRPIRAYDRDGFLFGDHFVDLFVEDCLIMELKACTSLAEEHIPQTLGYLRATNCRDALLINFGAPKIQIGKKFL
jgi:GxxExxY protein